MEKGKKSVGDDYQSQNIIVKMVYLHKNLWRLSTYIIKDREQGMSERGKLSYKKGQQNMERERTCRVDSLHNIFHNKIML